MTYTAGGLIEATDYNGFVNVSANNVNAIWGTGSGDKGWGQTALSTVSTGATVTATSWASLVNTLTSMGNQTNTTLTARTAPVSTNTITILNNIATDINSITNNRGNAVAGGTSSSTWTGNAAKTTTTGTGNNAWTITFTQTVTFPSADQARYFWNAGGRVYLQFNKTSTGLDSDPDWNSFINGAGTLTFVGRVNGADQRIISTTYTGTTIDSRTTGTVTTLASTTGWYSLGSGAAATTIYQLNDTVSPYTGNYLRVTAAVDAGRTALTLVTTFNSTARTGAGQNTQISGGTDTPSNFFSFGTAPATVCRFIPPSTTYLTDSWGTPTVSCSVA